ncbi:MAG TPA: hypothetical protein PLH67_02780 [Lentisphaeria bacterium]|nr:hypothetical protein [Lentisphaeria bacterium]
MTKRIQLQRFNDALHNLPTPGTGCHAALLGAANYGVMAGLSDADILAELRAAIKPGTRQVQDKEISEAVAKARQELRAAPAWTGQVTPRAGQKPPTTATATAQLPMDASAVAARQARLIEAGGGPFDPLADPARAAAGSNPPWPEWEAMSPRGDVLTFLQSLYNDDDLLYIGPDAARREDQANYIKPAAEWVEFFRAQQAEGTDPAKLGRAFPFICCNPLTGEPNESGSRRSDSNVVAFRFAVLEHDILPLDQQIALIRALELPIVAMTFSGGKSVHALLDVAAYCGEVITTHERWRQVVKEALFETCLKPYEFDTSTSNPSRFSRLPGVIRAEDGARGRGVRPSVPLPSLTQSSPEPPPPTAPENPPPAERWQRLLYINGRAWA